MNRTLFRGSLKEIDDVSPLVPKENNALLGRKSQSLRNVFSFEVDSGILLSPRKAGASSKRASISAIGPIERLHSSDSFTNVERTLNMSPIVERSSSGVSRAQSETVAATTPIQPRRTSRSDSHSNRKNRKVVGEIEKPQFRGPGGLVRQNSQLSLQSSGEVLKSPRRITQKRSSLLMYPSTPRTPPNSSEKIDSPHSKSASENSDPDPSSRHSRSSHSRSNHSNRRLSRNKASGLQMAPPLDSRPPPSAPQSPKKRASKGPTQTPRTPSVRKERSCVPPTPAPMTPRDLQNSFQKIDFNVEKSDRSQEDPVVVKPASVGVTRLYEYARKCQWGLVHEEVQKYPRDAKCVGTKDGTTALHLAVMSRTNPMLRDRALGNFEPASIELIAQLVDACPEAAIIRCSVKKYTPLSYACLVSDKGYDMQNAEEIVRVLLRYAPESAYVFTDDGFSALDVHILSYSRCNQQKEEVYSCGRSSTAVLRALLSEKPFLAHARMYKNKTRGPIELLYRCNMDEFKRASGEESFGLAEETKRGVSRLDSIGGSLRAHTAATVTSVLSEWWAWKWAVILLKFASLSEADDGSEFSVVHSASRLVGCPHSILMLAMNIFPKQARARDPRDGLDNLPLHNVCSWIADYEIVCGDPFVNRRKTRAIGALLQEYPGAARVLNKMDESPLLLAVETCTPWDGGLDVIVAACPKALRLPRKLRAFSETNYLAISVPFEDDEDSVCSDDTDWNESTKALEGMYPFLIAAVMAHVPESRRKGPAFLYEDQTPEEHDASLAKKDREALRSVYGLLRADPEVLSIYIKETTIRFLELEIESRKQDKFDEGSETEYEEESYLAGEASEDEEVVEVVDDEESMSID